MNENQQGPMENLLDGLHQHAKFLSDEELKAELKARGVEVDGFLSEAHAIASKHLKEDRLSWMKVADAKKQHIQTTANIAETWLGKGELAVTQAWDAFLARVGPKQALAFRNKTDLSIADKARILDDFERLRLRNADKKPKQGD